jgi:predicted unusual protein kinase regulating ubiquinone biosynthesis (AarF/ABC1/UbiB family)
MPPAQLKRVLQDSYGKDALRLFRRFDPRPVAAASIGQVHRAETREGNAIALKIQYPGVRDAIDADVANLGTLLRLSGLLPEGFDLDPFLDEARRQLHDEADYRREAEALVRFRRLAKDQPDVVVPAFFPEVSTDTILAMGFVDSAPIETLETAPQAARDSAATRLFDIFLREVLDWRVVQTDPNFANFRYQPDHGRLVLLDFGATRPVPEAFVVGCQRLLQAGVAGDLSAVMDGLCDLSILPKDLSTGQSKVITQMAHLILPMLSQDMTDFDDPERLAALREAGARLGLDEGFRHIPPWDALYLQRKLGGLVLLATRLRARVPLSRLVQEALARVQGEPAQRP